MSKIHRLNAVFNESSSTLLSIDALTDKLCDIIGSNIYLFDTSGNIFAYSVAPEFNCPYTKCSLIDGKLPQYYMDLYNKINTSIVNRYQELPECTYKDVKECLFRNRYYSILPIFSNFKKAAGILFVKYETPFLPSDGILCEYIVAIVSLEMLRREQENIQQTSIEIAKAKVAVNSLTFNEIKAVKYIMKNIAGEEGEVFLKSVASHTYTTPSTVSSALKKLEVATVITTKSRGVKGKYIRILNENLMDELEQLQEES